MQASGRPRRVLLVDRDVDALDQLGGALRERGFEVALATGPRMACERAKASTYDVVIAARDVAEPEDGELGVLDALSVELPHVPPLIVLVEEEAGASEARIVRRDVDAIARKIDEVAQRSRSEHVSPSVTSHALDRAYLADLLLVLGTERRSGTLTVTTSKGSGEVRLVDGEIADAVYVRLEGKKALGRMISERDGTATFVPGAPAIMRRIDVPTRALVEEARTLADRAEELRDHAASIANGLLVATAPGDASSAIDQQLLARLRAPATLDALLDELPQPDAVILGAALELAARGVIKQVEHGASRVQLCPPEQLHLVRASAARAKVKGFAGPARLVFAATPARLAVLEHTVLSLADAVPPAAPEPPLPVPHALATLRLGDGVELDVIALPLVPAYAPLWPMALAGAAVAVRFDEGASQPLEEACGSVGVKILDARDVFGAVEESNPVQIARLVRVALEIEPGA